MTWHRQSTNAGPAGAVGGRRIAAAALLVWLLAVAQSGAQPPEDPPAEAEPAGDMESLDDDLFRRLLEDGAAPAEAMNLLDRAVTNMRSSADNLGRQETGAPTRTLQEETLKILEELIRQAQQPPPQSPPPPDSGSPPPPQDQPQGGNDAQPQPQPAPSQGEPVPMSEQQDEPQPASGQGEDREQAENTEDRNDEAERVRAETARREEMIRAVWGHLPANVRDKLLNIQSDETLPAYRDLARRYFEALAEDENASGR